MNFTCTADEADQGDRCSRASEMGNKEAEAKISVSMMSHRSLREGCAERVWNSHYRRSFEWKVFGQIEVEMKRSAFVWAVGLVIFPVSGRCDCWGIQVGTHSRFDCAFPVENTGIIIGNRETLDGGACERQESERARRSSDLPRWGWFGDRAVPRM